MKKFKKAMALSLALAMGLSLAACGKKDDDKKDDTTKAPATSGDETNGDVDTEEVTDLPEDTGSVLNIYVWNTEFQERVEGFYPGYEKTDDVTGKIGDVTVNWNITPNTDNAYQDNLDAKLLEQDSAADDDKIDMFLVEADYALKYVDTDYTLPVADCGVTSADVAEQYQYTKDVMTDSNGVLKGVSWQGCPGVLIYNREIAKDMWGSDDPAEVQKHVSDWATFYATADELKEAGYLATATCMDTFRVYSNNVTSKWVDADKNLNIDANIKAWVDDTKKMVDAGECKVDGLWSETWNKGFYPDGKVFAYFGPAWMIDFSMAADTDGSIANQGGWGATTGPQGFFWGGTWICACTGTDNANLVGDIMKTLTCDADVMKQIVIEKNDFVNNKSAMNEMAADTSYSNAVLGGQNALGMFAEGADKIDLSNLSNYDQGCNEAFQGAMQDYFNGKYSSYDDAVAAFKDDISAKYPAVNVD